MAQRLRKTHQDEVRSKIKTSQLINRLTNHALGTLKSPLDASQVRAIEILLKKTVPDLSSVDLTADVSAKIVGRVTFKGLND